MLSNGRTPRVGTQHWMWADPRWGRIEVTLANSLLVNQFGKAYIQGLQGDDLISCDGDRQAFVGHLVAGKLRTCIWVKKCGYLFAPFRLQLRC